MITFEINSGNIHQNQPSLMCSSTEFVQETTEHDGSILMVVNESTHKVTGYYMAFNGYWNEL